MKKFFLMIFALWGCISILNSQVSLVKDIHPGSEGGLNASSIKGIYNDGHLIFPAFTTEFGTELWISDGTDDGTVLLKDINSGPASSEPARFILAFDMVYFVATTATEGKELWVTDGTPDGTALVMDIEPGIASSDPLLGAVYKDYLYFAATNTNDREIWRIGVENIPSLFYNLNPTAQSRPRSFTVIGDKMYFAANEHAVDFTVNDEDEPFVTDGTTEGTLKLIDVTLNSHGAGVRDFVGLGDEVYFLASTNGGANPIHHEIFKTDGTPANTVLLQDLLGSQWLTPYTNFLVFFYESALHKISSDGNYSLIGGINNDNAYFTPNRIVNFNNTLYIPAGNSNGSTGVEIYSSKGTNLTTDLLQDIFPGTGSSNPMNLTIAGNKIVFVASSSDTNRELYETDGTSDGTKVIYDLNPGDEGSNPIALVLGEDVVYFYAFTHETGFELYKYELQPSSVSVINETFVGKIYPQPASDKIIIEWPESKLWESAKLLDPNGKLVTSYKVKNISSMEIEISDLAPGIYYFSLSAGHYETIASIIIQ